MTSTPKTIQEDLARSKSYYQRNDVLRSLMGLGNALRGLVGAKVAGPDKARIDTMLRESYQNINKFEKVREFAPKGLAYVKGEEKTMLAALLPVVKQIDEALKREGLEAMRARKLLIDQMVIKGNKLLAEKNVGEAMRCYREAVAEFKDETGLFPLIATRLIDTGHFKQSIEFSRRAVFESPANPRAHDLLQTGLIKTGDWDAADKFFAEAQKQLGENAYFLQLQAMIKAKRGDLPGAAAAAEKALALDSSLEQAAKILKKAKSG
jgi:tetratricopeptide (TPR) repeat protein